MKSSFNVKILVFLFFSTSCKKQWVGFYGSELDSGLKHLASSTLELKKDESFKLVYSMTSLESTTPSTRIVELKGKFGRTVDQIELMPDTKRVNSLSYGKNPDSLNFSHDGVRRSALVVIDTFYGQVQRIEESEPITLHLTSKSNSKYLWNDQNCFVKFDNPDVRYDLKNYCSEIRTVK